MTRAADPAPARAWGLHLLVLIGVYTVSLISLALFLADITAFVVFFGVAWVPCAAVYTALSTIVLATSPPGRRSLARAHAIALTVVALVLLFVLLGPLLGR